MPCDAFDVSISGDCAGDRDVLLDRADLHREIEREELLRADADAAAVDRLVALQGGLDGVGAGIDVGEDVLAALVGRRSSA